MRRLSTLMILALVCPFIHARNLREDVARYEKYPMEDVEKILENTEKAPNDAKRDLLDKLRDFYLSDPSEKKILQQQDVNQGYFLQKKITKEWNVNIQRLFIKDILSNPIKGFHILEAPNISAMHLALARIYMRQKDSYHASYHYTQALRFRTLKMNPDVYMDPNRLKLLRKDDPQIDAASEYQSILKEMEENEKKEREARENEIVLKDALLNQKASNRDILDEQLRKNRELMDSMRKKNNDLLDRKKKSEDKFREYEKSHNKSSSVILNEMAVLIREIEDANKERQKVIYKKSFYKTQFNQTFLHDYSQNRDYTAYANYLDMSSRLDPENAKIPFLLAKEYKLSQKPHKAIDAYQKSLEANQKVAGQLNDGELKAVYLNLAGLYYETKKYVDSAYYYQLSMEKTSDPDEKKNLTFQLGKLHTNKTGNYKESIRLLQGYLTELNGLNPSDPHQRAEWNREKFHAYHFLSISYQKNLNMTEYEKSLTGARESYEDIEKIIEEQKKIIEVAFTKMQDSKKNLLNDTRQEDLSAYNRNKTEYEKENLFLNELYSIKKSFPLRNIYFSLAEYLERKPDYKSALETYQMAERKGISPDEARRQIQRMRNMYGVSL